MFIEWIDKRDKRMKEERAAKQRKEALVSRDLHTLVVAQLRDSEGSILGRIRRKGCELPTGCVVSGKDRVKVVLCTAGSIIPCDGGSYVPAHRVHHIDIKSYLDE